jgi:hypothetical protein
MPDFPIRKTQLLVEDITHDGGAPLQEPTRRAAMLALVKNPFAGIWEPHLEQAMDDLKPLGQMMSEQLIDAMGGADKVEAYGKGAIVGANGEIEHGALWHVPGGYAMRGLVSPSKAIVPSAMKTGPMGARIDIPLGHVNAAYVRSHFDAIEVGFPDGPHADEICFILAMARGGRPHARMGGLEIDQVKGEDGLR